MMIDLGDYYNLLNLRKDDEGNPELSRRERQAVVSRFLHNYSKYNSLVNDTQVDEHFIPITMTVEKLSPEYEDVLYKIEEDLNEKVSVFLSGLSLPAEGVISFINNGEIAVVTYTSKVDLQIALNDLTVNKINNGKFLTDFPIFKDVTMDAMCDMLLYMESKQSEPGNEVSNKVMNILRGYVQQLYVGD